MLFSSHNAETDRLAVGTEPSEDADPDLMDAKCVPTQATFNVFFPV